MSELVDRQTQSNQTVAVALPRQRQSLGAWLRALVESWRYPASEHRDLRLDLLRGFAVFVMVVDHFGGASWLYLITGNNSFFTSGAEAFVVISGMVVGIVYGGIARREGLRAAVYKALQRAWTLYRLTIVMTLGFAMVSDFYKLPWSKGVDLSDPLQFTINVIILRQTYYLADIPLLYTFLMAFAPIGLWLLYRNHTRWLLLGSFAIWFFFQHSRDQFIFAPIVGNTTFHPPAWQLLFFWAMAFGYHRQAIYNRLSVLPKWPYFLFSALLFIWLLHLYSTEVSVLARLYPGIDVKLVVTELFNKSTVAPGRILATLIVFQFAYLFCTFFWKPIWAALGWFLLPLGQNSLYSYTMHVVIIGVFYIMLPLLPGIQEMGTINTALQLGVLFLLWWLIRRQFAFDIVPR